jgi:hypothetical protein
MPSLSSSAVNSLYVIFVLWLKLSCRRQTAGQSSF